MAIKLFCSYAHEDEELLNKLKVQLSPLEREGLIELWHDRDISAGTEWEHEIDAHLDAAGIILLLISPDFMNSNYCYSVEMKQAIDRHNAGEARVIPILLRPTDWQGAPFRKFQALPTNAEPITCWRNRDEAFLNVVQGIRKDIQQMTPHSEVPVPPEGATEPVPVSEPIARLPDLSQHKRKRVLRPHKRRGIQIVLIALLIAVVVSSVLVALFVSRGGSSPIVGHAFFTSSGAAPGANNLGINDRFQVKLSNVPLPQAGNSYYAWLLPDLNREASPLALGTLMVTNGVASLPSPYVDPQHDNLLSYFSRFLVTEEPKSPVPLSYSLDQGTRRYYAEIPQNPPAKDCLAVINQLNDLCHLRHLLSGDPKLAQVNLPGGLNYWFLHNVKEIQKWAGEVVDRNDPVGIRHKVVDILYMLGGTNCVAQDILAAAPGRENTPDDGTLTKVAAIPLLDCSLMPNVSGYLAHIHNHLNAIVLSPGVLQEQVTLAENISAEFNTINAWLRQVQQDARQLVAMDDPHLVLADGNRLRSEMDTLAGEVLNGGIDPNTGTAENGVAYIAAQIQQLAIMDVTRY